MMLTFAIAVFAAVLGGIVGWFITQQRFTQRLAALSDDKHQLDIDVSALRQNLRGLSERSDE